MTEDILKDVYPEVKYMAMKKIEQEEREQAESFKEDIRNKYPPGSLEYELKNARLKDEAIMRRNREQD